MDINTATEQIKKNNLFILSEYGYDDANMYILINIV